MKISSGTFNSVAAAILLSGCSSNGPGSQVMEGRFMGPAAVQGVAYSTATQSGRTDTQGRFKYLPGEQVSFSLGGIDLGSSVGADQLSPFELNQIDPAITSLEMQGYFSRSASNSFFTALNTLRLLYVLDRDHDVDNGIQLDDLDERMAGEQLDFDGDIDTFADSQRYRQLLESYGGLPVNHAEFIHTSMSELQVVSQLQAPVMIERDDDNNGITDSIEYITYNTDGLIASTESDSDADGNIESRNDYEYDEQKRMLRALIDSNGNGVVDFINLFEYDARGNIISTRDDVGANGSIDRRTQMDYDRYDHRVQRREDRDNDGTFEAAVNYNFDDRGNEILYATDADYDGIADQVYRYFFNDQNQRIRAEYDNDADGVADRIYYFEYDARGRGSVDRYDNDADGSIDYVTTVEYDTLDRPVAWHTDTNNDGVIDRSRFQEYNDQHQVTVELNDRRSALGSVREYRYKSFDANGLPVLDQRDNDGDGVMDVTRSTVYHYEPVGHLYMLHR